MGMKLHPDVEAKVLAAAATIAPRRKMSILWSTYCIPIKLVSLANVRMHWRTLARLKKKQRQQVANAVLGHLPSMPIRVTLTRVGKRRMDNDNLAAAFKAVRDEIANIYGVDDGSMQYEWVYDQEIGKEYAVKILIESLPVKEK